MTISNIPYQNYSVYVYFNNNNSGSAANVSISGSATTFFASAFGGSNPTSYKPATGTTSATPTTGANYALWTGITGSSLTVTQVGTTNTPWIAGVPIVANPNRTSQLRCRCQRKLDNQSRRRLKQSAN